MTRNTILAVIAIGAALALWLALRGDSADPARNAAGTGSGTAVERAGDRAVDRPDANPLARRPGGAEGADQPAGASPVAVVPGSTLSDGESASLDAEPGYPGELPSAGSDLSSGGESGRAPETEAQAGGMPRQLPLGRSGIAAREPESAPVTEVPEPAPDEPDRSDPLAPSEPAAEDAEILSAEEIQERVEKILPDGSMPEDELARAREAEARRILERSKIAAGLAR
jgi:hypothetical protein